MVAKLRLPFPLLSDPGGEQAIKPYGLWHPEDHGGIARPAIVLVTPDGEEAFRYVGRDFADRPTEEEVVQKVAALGLKPVTQEPPTPGTPEPGERAMPVQDLIPYFRGARFAAKAMAMRHPEIGDDAERYIEEVDRYRQAVRELTRS